MLRLVGSMRESRVQAATFLVAASDGHSEAKVASLARERGWRGWRVVRVPRSREVGQSYATSVLTTLWALLWCLGVVARERPHVVLLNGPGTCLPVAFWARVLGTLPGVPSPHVLFVESIARVRELSLTGRLLLRLRLATRVFGQWDEIVEREGVEAIPRLY